MSTLEPCSMSMEGADHFMDTNQSLRSESGRYGYEAIEVASFAPLASKLYLHLEGLESGTTPLMQELRANIHLLQESFISTLYSILLSHDIATHEKITLRLHSESPIIFLHGTHPDKERIEKVLDAHPELAIIFFEVAQQAAALKCLNSLHAMAQSALCKTGPVKIVSSYKVNIKKEMSHFFFAETEFF